jgi:hypothetical protein
METKQVTKVIDTMNVMDRARALQGMHQAVLFGKPCGCLRRSRAWRTSTAPPRR